jgi:hypothetical protein
MALPARVARRSLPFGLGDAHLTCLPPRRRLGWASRRWSCLVVSGLRGPSERACDVVGSAEKADVGGNR